MGYDSLVTSVVDTIKNDGKIYEITPFFKLTTVSVSYTHLDVYKRQMR